jgi:hypothetical protein
VNRHIWFFLLSIFLSIFGCYTLLNRVEPFLYYFYVALWWSYIILLDTIFARRKGQFLVLNKDLILTIFVSSAFWCLFEVINLRLDNWSYANLPKGVLERYLGYLLAFGTVVPAIYLTTEFVHMITGDIRIKPFHITHYSFYAVVSGLVLLLAVYLLPSYCFAFTWVFLALILDGYNYSKGYRSFMNEFEQGSGGTLAATLISGLICGLLWEAWNFHSVSRWVYHVPLFKDLKVFEMPLPGYLGFPPFALETITFVNLLHGTKVLRRHYLVILALSVLVAAVSFPLIDKHTVLSFAAKNPVSP